MRPTWGSFVHEEPQDRKVRKFIELHFYINISTC